MLKRHARFILLALSLFFSFSIAANAASVNGLFHHEGDPVAGNPKGSVTVVEFFDYQCSHCINMASVISSVIKANPNVRVVFKDFPIRGPVSEFAARAALAANKQGKYYEFSHALLMTTLSLNNDTILDIAKSAGLDMARLKKDMNSPAINNEIKNTYALAQEFQVTGTPAFFIGKTDAKNNKDVNFVLGEMSESELQDAINKAKS